MAAMRWWLCVTLLLLCCCCRFCRGASGLREEGEAAGRRPCWEAEIRCLQEAECKRAYSQYLRACEGVLRSAPWRDPAEGAEQEEQEEHEEDDAPGTQCPSHCIHALIRLNQTRSGPQLESCDCREDALCLGYKRIIEPCMPRTYSARRAVDGGEGGEEEKGGPMGCTEARQRCQEEPECGGAMEQYLMSCGKLFNGARCTAGCRDIIGRMLAVPRALALSECVCDGLERPFCEVVKDNMARLCFGGAAESGSGASTDDFYDDEELHGDEGPGPPVPGPHGPRAALGSRGARVRSSYGAQLGALAWVAWHAAHAA
ncbi:unnamed protein product [Lampetra planeri]